MPNGNKDAMCRAVESFAGFRIAQTNARHAQRLIITENFFKRCIPQNFDFRIIK